MKRIKICKGCGKEMDEFDISVDVKKCHQCYLDEIVEEYN